jgi:acyl transferase domain-containing protein
MAETHDLDGIAVIGMSCRFPGARNVDEYWNNLAAGVASISFFSDEEVAPPRDRSMLHHPNVVKAGAILEDTDQFDAAFFDFNPLEAETTDPQHRVFLECCYEALEGAGYAPRSCTVPVGIFAGANISMYISALNPGPVGGLQAAIGGDKDYLTTRVSYKLNLTGPSLSIQTACSTSLVAISMACDSLTDYQCDMALAGGAAIRVPQKTAYVYEDGSILSPDGHCRTFDARSRGTVFGNGVGVVALKRLKDALRDGDRIDAVVRGSAVNNDGSVKIGYTAPGVLGQSKVITMALAMSGVSPRTITYVEAHGTGTSIGDPIEVDALTRAYRTGTQACGYCAIGSVKTNVGHLESAAGVAAFIKTVLALRHKQIPASLNFENPNPAIDFANSPFYVNTQLAEWKTEGVPRRAGVSSFGIGGTNAHIVLEEAPAVAASLPGRAPHLLLISAKSAAARDTAAANLAAHLERHPDINLADVAYMLAVGRQSFDHPR